MGNRCRRYGKGCYVSGSGTTRVSVAVMAHPARADMVPDLLKGLDRNAEVVWDTDNDRWETGRRSLLAFSSTATHHLVIQDDGIPSRDLLATCEVITSHYPTNPIGLYVGKLRPSHPRIEAMVKHVNKSNSPYLSMEGPWWGVGIVLPVADIPAVVAYGDSRPTVPNYDRRISRYYQSVNTPCLYTIPSLVEHRPDHPSLVPGRKGGRQAHQFIGESTSGLTIDWSLPPASPPETGFLPTSRANRVACWYCDHYSPSLHRITSHLKGLHPQHFATKVAP